MNPKRKRILFLVDNKNWCWTTQARSIAKHLPEYDFSIVPQKEFSTHSKTLLAVCDLVYMRGYPDIFLKNVGMINKPFIWTLSTGGANLDTRIEQSRKYKKVSSACVTQNLVATKAAKKAGFKNVTLIPCGVDTVKFSPSDKHYEYVVGFAGNSKGNRGDLKGSLLVKEACEQLGILYREVNLDNKLTPDEMPDFYRSLMIYAQPSEAEGCSNSVFEAMASGIPCLIVKGVGYHGEACEHAKNCIFVERNVDSIKYFIRQLIGYKKTYSRISKESRIFAEVHSWESIIGKYRSIIKKVIK